jgi:hypothetical protein
MNIPAFDDFGDPDRSLRAGNLTRVAHWVPAALLITMIVRIVHWFSDLIPVWLGVGVEVVMIVTMITMFLHQGLARICLRCMEEVKPDAPLQAQRKRKILKIWHLGQSWRVSLAWLAAILLTNGVRIWLNDDFGYDWHWINAPTDVIFGLWIYSMVFHHRVSPWCPYCRRWDDGGDHEAIPDPVEPSTKVA